MTLSTNNHDRDKAGLSYVYPVLSRRSGGLSIGINLNTNNACNWQCIYCQVPDLVRGSAPAVNFEKFEDEFRYFLKDVIHGDFYERESVPDEDRVIRDIAISGNGEPTTAKDFEHVVDVINTVISEYDINRKAKIVLITNGSMMNKQAVQSGIRKITESGGEVWFKVDSVTPAGIDRINIVKGSVDSTLKKLTISCELCPTWIQTCFFALDKNSPTEKETNAYLNFLNTIKSENISIEGVLLYGIARPSMQPGADKLSRLPEEWLQQFASQINQYGIKVKISP